jgi:hypothetical protein
MITRRGMFMVVEALVALMIVAAYLLVLTHGAGVLRELL